jgi:hypothetical protein
MEVEEKLRREKCVYNTARTKRISKQVRFRQSLLVDSATATHHQAVMNP